MLDNRWLRESRAGASFRAPEVPEPRVAQAAWREASDASCPAVASSFTGATPRSATTTDSTTGTTLFTTPGSCCKRAGGRGASAEASRLSALQDPEVPASPAAPSKVTSSAGLVASPSPALSPAPLSPAPVSVTKPPMAVTEACPSGECSDADPPGPVGPAPVTSETEIDEMIGISSGCGGAWVRGAASGPPTSGAPTSGASARCEAAPAVPAMKSRAKAVTTRDSTAKGTAPGRLTPPALLTIIRPSLLPKPA